MGRWGDGEMGRWGDGEMGGTLKTGLDPQDSSTPKSLLPTPYSLLPTPYSLLPTPCSEVPTTQPTGKSLY
ncbi:hypothetical protein [Moorena sp. SIO4A5]|uniref:hypothetical protein n=1 Tax=Moorena sp. SIO4A5 TaxID=2607838 RepID=UPI0013CB1073|nr:hypothetical protein [Moorena sp. SIO4A5]NEO23537.1 hypothetical protein [Moorena sp. SIO4A5]